MTTEDFSPYFDRVDEAHDILGDGLVRRFRATLHPYLAEAGDGAPLGSHWCLFEPAGPISALKPDGHPLDIPLLPRFPETRRMWAGGEVEFIAPVPVGRSLRRVSRLRTIEAKGGNSGAFHLVRIEHALFCSDDLLLRERQDLVFLPARRLSAPDARQPAGPIVPATIAGADSVVVGHGSPVLLFRYSAITFNAHRIHYDAPYAMSEEGYPGVVVHGPMQATLLMNLAQRRSGRVPARFTYRGLAPLIAGQEFALCAGPIQAGEGQGGSQALWVQDADGMVTMRAEANFT